MDNYNFDKTRDKATAKHSGPSFLFGGLENCDVQNGRIAGEIA